MRNIISFLCSFAINTKITDYGVLNILEGLSKHKTLKKLDLNFKFCSELTEASIQTMTQHFQYYSHELTHLNLSFNGETTLDLLDKFCYSLVHLERLYSLSLDFCDSKIDMKALFALRIISALPQLRKLHLDIHDCPSVNYQGLMYVIRALDSMPYLTSISFVLSHYSDITGSMLAEFGITLGRIAFLENLNLVMNFKDVQTKDVKTFF